MRRKKKKRTDDFQYVVNPLLTGVGGVLPACVPEDVWVATATQYIKQYGAPRFLTRLLAELRHGLRLSATRDTLITALVEALFAAGLDFTFTEAPEAEQPATGRAFKCEVALACPSRCPLCTQLREGPALKALAQYRIESQLYLDSFKEHDLLQAADTTHAPDCPRWWRGTCACV